jgi:hypothetical protein
MITEEDCIWAIQLWGGLAEGGRWIVPDLGVYERTGENQIVLVELYAALPTHKMTKESRTLFDDHEYLVELGKHIGWEVGLAIEKAWNQEGEVLNIPEDRYGEAAVCSKQCGTIVRIEPPEPGKIMIQITDRKCPTCGKQGFTKAWDNLHVVMDDRGARIKQILSEEE